MNVDMVTALPPSPTTPNTLPFRGSSTSLALSRLPYLLSFLQSACTISICHLLCLLHIAKSNLSCCIPLQILPAYERLYGIGLNMYNLYASCWGGANYQERYEADLSNLFRQYQFNVPVPVSSWADLW